MSKKDEYGLGFVKITSNGNTGYNCIRKNGVVDQNNLLQFLSDLDILRTEFLLKEINDYLNDTPNHDWSSYDSLVLEHINLTLNYPDFIIDEQPHPFPLADIRDLLMEWLYFLRS